MRVVTVILPTYNRGAMIGDAIGSVLRQTLTDWELLIVDDGSTDHTAEVVARVRDRRVRYVYQPHAGLACARNTGIRQTQGRYVACLDSDDLFLPEKLRRQAAILDADPGLGLVGGGYLQVDAHLRLLRNVQPWTALPCLTLLEWLRGCPLVPSATLVRRVWLQRAGLFDETLRHVEDWDLWLRMAHLGCRMAWIEEPVCAYRIHGGNMVRGVYGMKAGMLAMLDKLYAQPDLPADVLAAHDLAYSHVYLDAAARAYAAGMLTDAKAWLGKATDLHPALLGGSPPRVLDSLASFALSALVPDAETFMEGVVHNLPDRTGMPRWSNRQARALVHAVRAFESERSHHHLRAAVHALRAVLVDRAWLRNRGVLAVIGYALWRQAGALATARAARKGYGRVGHRLTLEGVVDGAAGFALSNPVRPQR